MVAPGFLMLGLAVTLFGALYYRRKKRESAGFTSHSMRLDFSDPAQRGAVAFFLTFIVVFIGMSVSRQLPRLRVHRFREFLRAAVPHGDGARIHRLPAVSACPRGVRGLPRWRRRHLVREVETIRRAAGVQDRPEHLSTPDSNAGAQPAPGAETCETCHWPKKFYGAQLKVFNHYSSDEKNTPRQIRMLIKTGGGDPRPVSPKASTGT